MVAPHDAGHGRDAASFPFGSDPLAGVAAVAMMSGKGDKDVKIQPYDARRNALARPY